MFLDNDKELAEREQDCWGYSLKNAMEFYLEGEFKKASIHLENAKRSLDELETLRNRKKQNDQLNLILKQIEGGLQQK